MRQADEIGRGLQAAGVAVRIGERGRGDVAEALALRISEHYHERAAVLEYDGERPRAEAEAEALAAAWASLPLKRRQTMNDPASAEATYRAPAFELLTTARDVFDLPQPAPVLWRDPRPPHRPRRSRRGAVRRRGRHTRECRRIGEKLLNPGPGRRDGDRSGGRPGVRERLRPASKGRRRRPGVVRRQPGPDRRPPALVHRDRPGAVASMGKPGAAVSDGP